MEILLVKIPLHISILVCPVIIFSGGESARSNDPLFMTPSRTHRPPSYPPSASYQRFVKEMYT